MFSPHRPAVASTSSPAQISTTPTAVPLATQSSNVVISLRTPESSPRIRKDSNNPEARFPVGRHRDKLDIIRDSLKPFEQPSTLDLSQSSLNSSAFSANTISGINNSNSNNNSINLNGCNAEEESRRRVMVKTLTQVGFDEESAQLALQLVRYSSVAQAAGVLFNLKQDHVFRQDIPRELQSLHGVPITMAHTPYSHVANNGLTYSNPKIATAQPSVPTVVINTQMPTTAVISTMDDSSSSRSESPLTRIPSPSAPTATFQTRPSSPPIQITTNPYGQPTEYHRLHAHLPLPTPKKALNNHDHGIAVASSSSQGTSVTTYTPSQLAAITCAHQVPQQTGLIKMDKNADRMTRPTKSMVTRTQMNANGVRRIERPMIRSRLDRPLHNNTRPITADPSHHKTDALYNLYTFNGVNDEVIDMNVVGPTQISNVNGVQRIFVDPDKPSSYANYVDQLCRRTNKLTIGDRDQYADHVESSHRNTVISANSVSPSSNSNRGWMEADGVTRCISPLPESISRKLRTNTYESVIKACKPRLFCFYMEQHVERLVQQYKEREQRAVQLAKEMECAELPEAMREHMMTFLTQKESRYLRLKRQKMNRNMFEVVKHIGFGAFGRVSLVKKKDTNQVYAMKKLIKKDIIKKQQAAHVKAERDILAEADSQWIVKLYFSFQDEQALYLIMEYVPGGDMMQLLINKGVFCEKLARFYIAELTCAIEYVHSLGFIHRDIKPDNILIDQNGHIKLTDFGLCTGLRWTHDKRYYGPENDEVEKPNSATDRFVFQSDAMNYMKVLDVGNHSKRNQAHSLVGTDNYMAPEVIRGTGHTQLCDWWSVGVILYEMVLGRPPFHADGRHETQYKIVHWRQYLDLSYGHIFNLSDDCIDAIRHLCCEQNERLGSKNGAEDVKAHRWFQNIDFATLRTTRAEYIPRVEHAADTSNFDTFIFDSSDQTFDTTAKKANSAATFNPAFYEFTFRHFFDFDGQGCPSFRKRRPSLAPLFEGNGMKASCATKTEQNNSQKFSDLYNSTDSMAV